MDSACERWLQLWRFRRRLPASYLLLGAALLWIGGRILWDVWPAAAEPPPRPAGEGFVEIIEIHSSVELVVRLESDASRDGAPLRLLGLRRSNLEAREREAIEFLEFFRQRGPLWLRLDRRRQDASGTALGYLYSGDILVNEELVRSGLVHLDDEQIPYLSQVRVLQRAEAEARELGAGLWRRKS